MGFSSFLSNMMTRSEIDKKKSEDLANKTKLMIKPNQEKKDPVVSSVESKASDFNPISFSSKEEAVNIAKGLGDQIRTLPQKDIEAIKFKKGQKEFLDLPLNKKLEYLRDSVVAYKFNSGTSKDTRTQVLDYMQKNNLSKQDRLKLMSAATTMPDKAISDIVTFVATNKEYANSEGDPMGGINEALGKLDLNTPEGQIKFNDAMSKMKDMLSVLKDGGKISEMAKNNAAVSKALSLDVIKAADVQQDEGFSFINAIISPIMKGSQRTQAALLKMRSLVSKDPQEEYALNLISKKVWDGAEGKHWYSPPTAAFDGFDTMKLIMGNKPVANTKIAQGLIDYEFEDFFKKYGSGGRVSLMLIKALNSLSGVDLEITDETRDTALSVDKFFSKAAFELTRGNQIKKELHDKYAKENGIDMMDYAKNVMYNQTVTLLGLANDAIMDPTNLFGTGIKVGSEGTKITKLAKDSILFRHVDVEKLAKTSKAFEQEILKIANKTLKIDVKDFSEAEKYVEGLQKSIQAFPPFPEDAKKVESIIRFRDLNEKVKKVKEARDSLIASSRFVKDNIAGKKSTPLLKYEAEKMVADLAEQAREFSLLSGKKNFLSDALHSTEVLVNDGTSRLSKKGMKLLKSYKSKGMNSAYSEVFQNQAELKVATDALSDPKIWDKGVKIFGLEVPGTRYLEDQTRNILSKVPVINRFPSTRASVVERINKFLREKEGSSQIAHDLTLGMHENLTRKDKVRLSLAIETGNLEALDNAKKLNQYGTLREIASQVKDVNDNLVAAKEVALDQEFLKVLQDRGFSPDVAKHFLEKNKALLLPDYLNDYQTVILRNRKALEQFKLRLRRQELGFSAIKDLKKANRSMQRTMDTSSFSVYSKDRLFDKRSDYYKAFINSSDAEGKVAVDKLIDNIVNDVDFEKSIKELEAIGKKGFDPVLESDTIMFARLNASGNSILKRRLNLDLAREVGLNTTITNFFKEDTALVDGLAKEFKGVSLPKDVTRALNMLDAPSTVSRLRTEVSTGMAFDKTRNLPSTHIALSEHQKVMKAIGLHFLEGADKVNNYFKMAVTHLFPKFHFRNAASNVVMNFQDVGATALDPVLNSKVASLVFNKGKKGFGKSMIFSNSYGETLTGEEMLHAMKENGVFIAFNKVAERTGAEDFYQMLRTGPFTKVGQGIEDHARAVNFIANWKRGHSFAESAARSRKVLVDYSNTSKETREYLNRAIPFFTFFQKNSINVIETLIKNPHRISMEIKALKAVGGYKAEAVPEASGYYPELPLVKKQNEPGTVTKMTSSFLTFEGLDQYTTVTRNLWKSLESYANNQDELGSNYFKKATSEGIKSIAPVYQIPFAFADKLLDGKLFYHKKLSGDVEKYLTFAPAWMREMVGLDFKENKRTGEINVRVSPMANLMFTMAGGSRFLSTYMGLGKEEGDLLEKISNYILPITTNSFNEEEIKKLYDQSKLISAEQISNSIKNQLNKAVKQEGLRQVKIKQIKNKKESK